MAGNAALRLQLGIACLAIMMNSLTAGGIFTFPLIAPALSEHLKLTQPQLTTIVLAGMIGQYPVASFVGMAIDQFGPWVCSLSSAYFFGTAFATFAMEVRRTPDDIELPSRSSFIILSICFFTAGLGTVTSYFSSLYAAAQVLPNHLGAASGFSLALFGLSPMVLSYFAQLFFTDQVTGEVDVYRFIMFLATLVPMIHVLSAISFSFLGRTLRRRSSAAQREAHSVPSVSPTQIVDENTRLLPGAPIPAVTDKQSVRNVVSDSSFWLLAFIAFVLLGASEMVLSNIGTILLSFPAIRATASATAKATATQVRLLSLSNTISRLIIGPLADATSKRVSRMVFLVGSAVLLCLTFAWTELGIRTQAEVGALSVGVGLAYGTAFTVLPGVISAVWGTANAARNFGLITWAPFLGTPTFSYLYAFVSARHVADSKQGDAVGVCYGTHCWRLTFWVCCASALSACVGAGVLWRRWKTVL